MDEMLSSVVLMCLLLVIITVSSKTGEAISGARNPKSWNDTYCPPKFRYHYVHLVGCVEEDIHDELLSIRLKQHVCNSPSIESRNMVTTIFPKGWYKDVQSLLLIGGECLEKVNNIAKEINPTNIFMISDAVNLQKLYMNGYSYVTQFQFAKILTVLHYEPDVVNGEYPKTEWASWTDSVPDMIAMEKNALDQHCVVYPRIDKRFKVWNETSLPKNHVPKYNDHIWRDTYGIPYHIEPICWFGPEDVSTMTHTLDFEARDVLIHAQYSVRGRGKAIRLELINQCEKYANSSICSYSAIDKDGVKKVNLSYPLLQDSMAHSKFTLNPHGNSVSRSDVMESIIYGSVPVLFSSCPSSIIRKNVWAKGYAPFMGTGMDGYGARSWGVMLSYTDALHNETYVVDELTAIDKDTFHRMQSIGRQLLFRNLYAKEYISNVTDAIDVIVLTMGHNCVPPKCYLNFKINVPKSNTA